jgi:hypothetical protein
MQEGAAEDLWAMAAVRTAAAQCAALLGRTEDALRWVAATLPAIDRAPGSTANYPQVLGCAVTALEALGRTDYVEILERNLREKWLQPDFRYPGTEARYSLGMLCGLQGRCDEAADWFAQARVIIAPEGGVALGTTVGGTTVFGSSCGNDILAPERLFQWTPSVSHVATIQTCGGTTNFDTTLYIREGACLGPDVACNDDACGSQSSITMPVVAGTTYFIVVDGFVVDAGTFTLSVF